MTKLKWGMIGGGEGSQIGPAHRLGSGLDDLFDFTAGALDHRPEQGRAYAQRLGLTADRSYGDWKEMLDGERNRDDRIDLVTVATPNSTHYEITKAFLEAGFHVLCEKPMTMTVEEGEDIVKTAESTGSLCAVNYGYTGYSLVRHMRAMIARGDLGKIRLVNCEFAHGHHADAADADNPRVRWRYDPAQAGVSAQFADCGIHAMHMASFVTGQEVTKLSADIVSWQEQPNQLYWMPLNERLQIIERGESELSPEADRTTRVTIGHAEGMPLAFANIYKDLAEAINATKEGRAIDPAADLFPRASDGLRSMAAVKAVAESGAKRATLSH